MGPHIYMKDEKLLKSCVLVSKTRALRYPPPSLQTCKSHMNADIHNGDCGHHPAARVLPALWPRARALTLETFQQGVSVNVGVSLRRGSSPRLGNTPVLGVHILGSVEARSTSSEMPAAEALRRLGTQGVRRFLGANSPPRGGCVTFGGSVTGGLERNSETKLKGPQLSCPRAQGTDTSKSVALRVVVCTHLQCVTESQVHSLRHVGLRAV